MCAGALLGVSLGANANFIARTTHGNFEVVRNGSSTTLKAPQTALGSGNAVASTGTINATPAAGVPTQGMGATAGGATAQAGVDLTGNAKVPVGTSNVPVAVKTNVGSDILIPAALGALGCASSGPAVAVACAGVAVAVPLASGWLSKAGARINPQTKQLEVQGDTEATPSDGYEYQTANAWGPPGWWATPQQACANAKPPGGSTEWQASNSFCYAFNAQGNYVQGSGYINRPSTCPAGNFVASDGSCKTEGGKPWLPASMNDIAPYMNKVPVDPGIVKELTDAGKDLGSPPVSVTGPASVQGPAVTNITNNSTTTSTTTVTTTTNNYTYNGPTITNVGSTSTQTQSTTTKNPDGSTTTTPGPTSTTSTTNGDAEAAKPEEQKTDCDKYPNSLGCSELDTPNVDIPKDTQTVTFSPEDFGGSGSCPVDQTVNLHTIGQSVKVTNWVQMCEWSLPLRGIVMALAFFAAFLIVMPGETRV